MKPGWEVKPLGEVCTVIAGQSPKGTAYNDEGEGLPFYQGKKDFTDRIISDPTTWSKQVTKEAIAGDILMSVRAPVGPINEASQRICIGRGLAAIRASDHVFKDYLWYTLLWKQPEIAGHEGAVFASINKKGIEALALPIPPLEEQKRIVSVLDAAFEGLTRAKENAETNLQNARELFESIARSVFGIGERDWPKATLPKVCSDFGRGKSRHRPRNEPSLYGGHYPFLQTGDLSQAGRTVSHSSQTYSEKGLAQSKLWPSGTVCIAIVGATIGESAITAMPACFPDSVIGMVPDQTKALSAYVQHLLEHYKDDLKAAGEGSARDNINLATFEDWAFPIPSVEHQSRVVEKLDQAAQSSGDLSAHYQSKLTDIADLRQSLLQKAFAGELT